MTTPTRQASSTGYNTPASTNGTVADYLQSPAHHQNANDNVATQHEQQLRRRAETQEAFDAEAAHQLYTGGRTAGTSTPPTAYDDYSSKKPTYATTDLETNKDTAEAATLLNEEDDDNNIYVQYGVPKRKHWPVWKKLCFVSCIFLMMSILVLIVLIVFLVRTPAVQIGAVTVMCPNILTCLQTSIPLTVAVHVNNDNIAGADVSGPVYLTTPSGISISNGSLTPAYVSARAVTTIYATFVVAPSEATSQIVTAILLEGQNYTLNVLADVDLKVAAIDTSITYNSTFTLTQADLPLGI